MYDRASEVWGRGEGREDEGGEEGDRLMWESLTLGRIMVPPTVEKDKKNFPRSCWKVALEAS